MIEVIQSATFAKWLRKLRDPRARIKILVRIRRLSLGNFGDVKSVGSGLHELRIDYGPGYRVYFINTDKSLVILLCGGDKQSQKLDVTRAMGLAKEWARLNAGKI